MLEPCSASVWDLVMLSEHAVALKALPFRGFCFVLRYLAYIHTLFPGGGYTVLSTRLVSGFLGEESSVKTSSHLSISAVRGRSNLELWRRSEVMGALECWTVMKRVLIMGRIVNDIGTRLCWTIFPIESLRSW